jgi:hypothetical protein
MIQPFNHFFNINNFILTTLPLPSKDRASYTSITNSPLPILSQDLASPTIKNNLTIIESSSHSFLVDKTVLEINISK